MVPCDRSAQADHEACTSLPGCVWALPGIEECGDDRDDPYDARPVSEGCYRTDCGNAYSDLYGLIGNDCDFDLCDTLAD